MESRAAECFSAARAVAWVTADRWYGRRTIRRASTNAREAARYPTRAPASENALLMVRLTARLPCAGGVPGRWGRRPGGTPRRPRRRRRCRPTALTSSSTASTVASGRAVPVGLLGLVSRTTEGRWRRTCSRAWSTSTVKSSSRRPVTHVVRVSRAYSGYIEYVGAKLRAVRPGPPKACSTWSMTSLDPLAAHTCSGSSSARTRCAGTPRGRRAGRGTRGRGVAVEAHRRLRDGGRDVGDDLGRDRVGVLVDVEDHRHVQLRGPRTGARPAGPRAAAGRPAWSSRSRQQCPRRADRPSHPEGGSGRSGRARGQTLRTLAIVPVRAPS